MGEACDDGNTIDGDGCESTCVPTGCGNGVITMGEGCDDGNIVDGDGCDSNCQPTGCGNGIKTMGETCDDGNKINCDGCRGNCSAVETGCADGFVCGMETCDDGNTTDADGCDSNCTLTGCGNGVITMGEDCDDANVTDDDGCDSNCTPTSCGNGVVTSGELCDDSNHIDDDGCDSNCTPTGCGNGVVTSGELCDDGNIIASDGCSNTCQVEPNYQCTIDTSPGVCILAETNCNNGIDDDGDMATDLADSDCALSNSVASCGVGESLYIYNSLDVPKFVEDLTTRDSKIVVASGGTVQKVVVRLSIEHPFDADLDIALESPQAGTVDVSSDNGEDGDDYTATIFDDTCSPPIGLATAPFTGCFAPDAPLASVTASNPDGVWTLHVTDDALGDHGTLLNWSLALCISP
jgi:cysteine-rich repeat protein